MSTNRAGLPDRLVCLPGGHAARLGRPAPGRQAPMAHRRRSTRRANGCSGAPGSIPDGSVWERSGQRYP
ncbi:VRR-NUC domain containing protein [Corynebacterium phage CL31]|nr:VRR-NUC domain containing protein [Corynebacterium phage CL31]